jgi:hypothetical protein
VSSCSRREEPWASKAAAAASHYLVGGHWLDGGDVSIGRHVKRVEVTVHSQHATHEEQEAGDEAKVQDNRELGVLEPHLCRVFSLALEHLLVSFVVRIRRQRGVDNVRVVRLREKKSKRVKSQMRRGLRGKCDRRAAANLKADVEEASKGERFVDKVLAFFVLQVVGDPEVLKELEKLHGKEEQDALSSAGSLHRRHLGLDIPGDEEAKHAEAWTRILGGAVEKSWNLTSGPIFVETHREVTVFRLYGTA